METFSQIIEALQERIYEEEHVSEEEWNRKKDYNEGHVDGLYRAIIIIKRLMNKE